MEIIAAKITKMVGTILTYDLDKPWDQVMEKFSSVFSNT